MKIKPILNNILIKPIEVEKQTQNGIFIPETAKEKSQKALVVEVGSGKFEHGQLQKPAVNKGEIVLFRMWSGEDITIEGVEHKFIKEEDILAILEDENA